MTCRPSKTSELRGAAADIKTAAFIAVEAKVAAVHSKSLILKRARGGRMNCDVKRDNIHLKPSIKRNKKSVPKTRSLIWKVICFLWEPRFVFSWKLAGKTMIKEMRSL